MIDHGGLSRAIARRGEHRTHEATGPCSSGADARLHPEKPETLGVVAQLPVEPLRDGARAALVGRLMQPPGRPQAAAFGGTIPVPLWLRPQRAYRTQRRSTLQSTRTPPSNNRSGRWAAPAVAAALPRRCLSIPGASLLSRVNYSCRFTSSAWPRC